MATAGDIAGDIAAPPIGASSLGGPLAAPAGTYAVERASRATRPFVSRPTLHLVRMGVFLVLIGFLAFILYRQILPAFRANPALNGLILGVLAIAIVLALVQVVRLYPEARFANALARGLAPRRVPRLLRPLAGALALRAGGRDLPGEVVRPHLDTLAGRLDEGRDPLRYIAGLLVLLGLLGTFWGLIGTLSELGRVIQSMRSGGGDAGAMFDELKNGLAAPLSGIGLAFSASLFGLAGSLVTGFLDLQAGGAQARFLAQVEDWLTAGTLAAGALAPAPLAEPATAPREAGPDLAAAVAQLTAALGEGTGGRAATQAMANLAEGIQGLVQHMRAEQQMIRDWVEAQAARERELAQVLGRLTRERVE